MHRSVRFLLAPHPACPLPCDSVNSPRALSLGSSTTGGPSDPAPVRAQGHYGTRAVTVCPCDRAGRRAPHRRHRDLHRPADARARGVDRVVRAEGQLRRRIRRSGPPVRSLRPARAWRGTPSSPTTSRSSATTVSPGRGASSPRRAPMRPSPCRITGPASTRGSTSPLAWMPSWSAAPPSCPRRTSSMPAPRAAARRHRMASSTPARQASPFRPATSTDSSCAARTATSTTSCAAT